MTRELKELFKTPTFYIALALFFFLCGFKFYTVLITFMNNSVNYPQLAYGTEYIGNNGDIYELVFTPFYRFVSVLLVIIIPIIIATIGHDRINSMDKIELLSSEKTELQYILKKIYSSCSVFFIVALILSFFPIILIPFISIDLVNIITTFIALLCIVIISSSISMPISILRFSEPVSILLNVCIMIPLYWYFFERKFIPFFAGVVKGNSIVWVIGITVFSLILSKVIYKSLRFF